MLGYGVRTKALTVEEKENSCKHASVVLTAVFWKVELVVHTVLSLGAGLILEGLSPAKGLKN